MKIHNFTVLSLQQVKNVGKNQQTTLFCAY